MQTRSSSKFVGEPSTNPTSMNPKRRNRRRSKQRVKPFALEEFPVVTMADQRTMAELLHAPAEGYAEAIVVAPIPAEHFELKHSLINLVTSKQFFGFEKEDPHAHIRYFNKITSTLKYKDVPNSLNYAAGGNLLERSAQDVLKIIENKSKVHNSRNKPIVSQVKTSNVDSSEIASVVASAMTAMFKQHQVTPAPASVKAVEESCVTCGGAHSYRQCPATDGNTFLGYHDNIQGYVSAAAVNYNQGNTGYRPPSVANQTRPPGFAQPYEQNNQNWYNQGYNQNKGNSSYQAPTQQTQVTTLSELEKFKKTNEASMQAMRNHIGNLKSELRNEMQATMSNQTNELKNMMASFFQMNTASSSGSGPLPSNTIANPKGELKSITTQSGIVLDGPSVPMPPPFINPEEDKRVEETLTDPKLVKYTIKKMLKALLSNKEKLLELANTPLNENCSAVILKKLPEKLGDPGKFLILCSFSELNCKALADLDATLAGIARDVFVPVGRFTFPADFVIVDYESDPRVPLILGRPFLRTARALIDVHGEELILRDGDERLILNMKHGTSSYSNKHQRESINMIDIYNISYKDYLEDLFANEKITNHLSGNPTFSSEPDTLTSDLTSPEVKDDIFDPEGDIVLIEKLLNLDSTKDLPPSPNVNPLSGSTTSSSPSLTTSEISDYSLEEFADELALIESFPPGNDDMTPEDVIREIEYLLNRDPLYSPNNDHIYTIPEMFTDEHTLDYSSHPRYDDADDDLFDLKTDNDEWGKIFYDDPFDSKENKIKVSKLLVDELDSTGSSSFLPYFLKNDSTLYEDFSEVDTLTSTDNEDKVFNPGILVHENLYEVTNRVTPDKNVKKISSSNASLILEDYNPPLSDHELPFHIEIPGSGTLLSFSSENEEKVFNPGILISKGVHSLLPELSHRDSKAFKVINIFESPMEIFPCSYGEDIRVLDVPLMNKCDVRRLAFSFFVFRVLCCMSRITPDYEASRARGFVHRSLELHILSFIMGIEYPNLID
ncbi:reverse transcriptase domain-containing protein [Tanacetum coccineum]